MSNDPFAPVQGARLGEGASADTGWKIMMPVPPDAPPAPTRQAALGRPTTVWTYRDAHDRILGYVHRYDVKGGGKEFRPVTLWHPAAGGPLKWRWTSWPAPRPLYGLTGLAERPFAPVLVTEGEKACDAAARLLPGPVHVTNPNGAKSADKADWSPLRGRSVVIWPDADSPGLAFARAAAKAIAAAGATSVAIISPPTGVAVGWDAADALAEGWTQERALKLVNSAAPFSDGKLPRRPRRDERSNAIIDALLHLEGFELWRDGSSATYATVPTAGHLENWSLRSFPIERWLAGFCYQKTGAAPSAQMLEDIRRLLDIKAYSEGATYEPAIRVGRHNDRLYLDCCDDEWHAVETSAQGWQVIRRPPVKFLRSMSARPLPEPVSGDMIEHLRRYINVANEDDFRLIVSWLVAALRPGLAFPILIINGAHGTGKSVLCKMLRRLIDPDMALIYSAPGNERDLVLAATNTWILNFDNMSEVSGYLADAVCRVSTGSGFRTRMLHTNRDEAVFWVQRPVLMNGIPMLTEAADLGDRAIVISLISIPGERRQPEADFWRDFEIDCARILGALLDGAARALHDVGKVTLTRPGRMADFEKWAMAAAAAFGWTGDQFQTAYRKNQTVVIDDALEADAVAVAISEFMPKEHPEGWEAPAAEWLIALDNAVSDRVRTARSWPKSPVQLGNRIKRAKPVLEHRGFTIDSRHSGKRTIIIVPPRDRSAARAAEGDD
jgi:putative DNA primase/helicase